jgi:hypothetical protein
MQHGIIAGNEIRISTGCFIKECSTVLLQEMRSELVQAVSEKNAARYYCRK